MGVFNGAACNGRRLGIHLDFTLFLSSFLEISERAISHDGVFMTRWELFNQTITTRHDWTTITIGKSTIQYQITSYVNISNTKASVDTFLNSTRCCIGGMVVVKPL